MPRTGQPRRHDRLGGQASELLAAQRVCCPLRTGARDRCLLRRPQPWRPGPGTVRSRRIRRLGQRRLRQGQRVYDHFRRFHATVGSEEVVDCQRVLDGYLSARRSSAPGAPHRPSAPEQARGGGMTREVMSNMLLPLILSATSHQGRQLAPLVTGSSVADDRRRYHS
jgi:hypothetical protein